MATEITMPQLSDTMDSGKIISWSKQEGDQIQRGDILAEVETDKANLEIESFHNGVLLKIVTPADGSADVGQVIAYIGEAGEAIPESNGSATNGSAPQQEATPEPQATAPSSPPAPTPSSPPAPVSPPTLSSPETSLTASNTGRVKASPLAKKLAKERGVNLDGLNGSGPDGRIVKRDIESAAQAPAATPQPTSAAPAPTPAPPSPAVQSTPAAPTADGSASPTADGSASPTADGSMVPFSKMRATIARRMQQSVNEAPHFYVTSSIRMDAVLALRKMLKEKNGYEKASVNHFIIKAAAYGIAAEPRVNYTVRDEQFVYQPAGINIGIITAIDDGLLIPVIKNADKMALKDIVFEARAAVDRARAGRPNAQDLTGGTFSISNMGMFDVESFTAIINPGQGSVLAVSSTQEQPIVENGKVTVGKIMKVTISVDHRIIDGVMAGNFLKAFKEALENPTLLFI